MPSRTSSQWQPARKRSLGKLQRAHPASGATWNVQVVRGKMTSKCLWHACRALVLGMVLMLLGAGMATVGYYANHLSTTHEIRGNATVRIRNESKGLHLNNLSYVGPIVMGFGGFIVVAACVMTFEARDSAAKVVPARFKNTTSNKSNIRSTNGNALSNRRTNGISSKSSRWDHHIGVFRASPSVEVPPPPLDRQALTAALIHFSKTIGNSPRLSPQQRRFSRSGSVPNLTSSPLQLHLSPRRKKLLLNQHFISRRHLHHHHHHNHQTYGQRLFKSRSSRTSSTLVHRESSSSLLHPGLLQLQRQALSVDESSPYLRTVTDSPHDSLTSVIVASSDVHEIGRLRDRTKRSDTAKRHILARQKPIEKDEPHSPKSILSDGRRRSSATSDASYASRHIIYRRTSSSRTPSIDSRSIQVELHSPEVVDKISPRTPRRFNSGQFSTPSVEREFRSQLSICSEPMTIRQLSGQSSLEPCVLEESPDFEEKESSSLSYNLDTNTIKIDQNFIASTIPTSSIPTTSNNSTFNTTTTTAITSQQSIIYSPKKQRPDNLQLNLNHTNLKKNNKIINESRKSLQRSNSSRTFYRPKSKPLNDYDQIYFINSRTINDNNQEDFHDSLRVINERRNTMLRNSSELSCSNEKIEKTLSSENQVNIINDKISSGKISSANNNSKENEINLSLDMDINTTELKINSNSSEINEEQKQDKNQIQTETHYDKTLPSSSNNLTEIPPINNETRIDIEEK